MNYRTLFTGMATILILTVVPIVGSVRSGEITVGSPKVTSSSSVFDGTLAVKEGHGDIFVRSENNRRAMRFKVDLDTVIIRNGQTAKYSELQAGDKVHVEYDSEHIALILQALGK